MKNNVINYGKTWEFSPNHIAFPASVEELQSIVKNAKKVRVMGAKHSWSKGIVTEDTLLSLDKMNRILDANFDKWQVTVEAGIRLKHLIAELEQRGLALLNLGSINEQSVAGAITTGTHGTGSNFQCLASTVQSFKLIDAEGNIHEYCKEDSHFYPILVGFGCFGIIYELTLKVTKSFQMHAITDTMLFTELIDNLDNYVKEYDHFKFWWLPSNDKVIVFKNNRTDKLRNDSDFVRWFKDELLAVVVYRSLLAIGKMNRSKFLPPINSFLTNEVGKKFERICKSYIGFLTPVPPIHRETEWAFDYKNAKELLRGYRQLLPTDGHTYNFVQEIRFSKGDDFWLSPAYKRDTMWLSMYNIDTNENWDAQLAKFETWAKANGGRPHWGKEATLDAAYFKKQYEKITDFHTLMKKMDAQGKFVNNWIQKIF